MVETKGPVLFFITVNGFINCGRSRGFFSGLFRLFVRTRLVQIGSFCGCAVLFFGGRRGRGRGITVFGAVLGPWGIGFFSRFGPAFASAAHQCRFERLALWRVRPSAWLQKTRHLKHDCDSTLYDLHPVCGLRTFQDRTRLSTGVDLELAATN